MNFIDKNVQRYPTPWLSMAVRSVPFYVSKHNEADLNPKLFAAMMCAAGRYDSHIRNAILHLRGAAID